jgi:hypothetical protein
LDSHCDGLGSSPGHVGFVVNKVAERPCCSSRGKSLDSHCDGLGSSPGHVGFVVDIQQQHQKGFKKLRHKPLVRVNISTYVEPNLLYLCCKCMGDRLCGLVVRVLGYRSEDPGSIPGTTRKKK